MADDQSDILRDVATATNLIAKMRQKLPTPCTYRI